MYTGKEMHMGSFFLLKKRKKEKIMIDTVLSPLFRGKHTVHAEEVARRHQMTREAHLHTYLHIKNTK